MNIAPYPDNDSSEWVIEFIEPPRVEDNFLQFSYAVYASQSSKDGGDPAFLYNSHKAQARNDHQRIKINSDETWNHVSGLTVKPEELDDFMANADEAYRWQVGGYQLLTNWQDDRGKELLPFWFPNYDGVDEAHDPQWVRERFRIEQNEHVRHLIRDKYFPGVMERRLSGDRRGTTLDLMVSGGSGDTHVEHTTIAWNILGTYHLTAVGRINSNRIYCGNGNRWTNVTVPQGTTVDVCYMTLTAGISDSTTTVNTHIVGDDEDNAAVFGTLANYQSRRGTSVGGANNNLRTTAEVDWNSIVTFSSGTEYDSPSTVTLIQEIVNRGGWSSGNAMVFFWDDHDNNSSAVAGVTRFGKSVEGDSSKAMQLHIEYTPPTTAAVTGEIGNGATEQAVRSAT